MIAYHGDPLLKERILAQLRAHAAADEIVKGKFWENGKGCAVGCTLHDSSGNHAAYETEFGIPQVLARLEDIIFEGLPYIEAKEWPIRFMSAIRTGTDLSDVSRQFLYRLLTDWNINPGIANPLVKDAVAQCAALFANKEPAARSTARSAESAARSAWSAAWSAGSAESAVELAAWSAESAARSAAWSAAWSAESAARSAAWSAWSAGSAGSAESAARLAARLAARSAAWSAESAARSVGSTEWSAWSKISNMLIQLLEAA